MSYEWFSDMLSCVIFCYHCRLKKMWYIVTRSRIVIDVLHAHGVCISNERILRVTKGLSEATLNLFEHEEAVIPGNLRTGLFTIGAKGNVDNWRREILREICQSFNQHTVERWENYLPFTWNLKRSRIVLKYFFHQFQ